jgi:hypothetical protein
MHAIRGSQGKYLQHNHSAKKVLTTNFTKGNTALVTSKNNENPIFKILDK